MGDDYEYTPQIVPVVDLTNVLEGADEIDNAFAATKSLSLDGDVSRNLANKIDAEVQLQNGLKSAGNEDTPRAINALAGHMDGVAEHQGHERDNQRQKGHWLHRRPDGTADRSESEVRKWQSSKN